MAYVAPAVNEYWKIVFAEESTYKNAETISTVNKWIGILDDDQELPFPEPNYEQFYGGGNAKPFLTVEGERLYPGRLKWKVQSGQLFKQLFGKVVDAGGPTYTHTFTCGTADARPLPSVNLAFWFDKTGDGGTPGTDDIFGRALGVKLGDATFTFEQGQALMLESNIQACSVQDENGSTFPTVTPNSTKPYMMKELGTITVHGLTVARIISGNINFSHNLQPFHYGQSDPYEHIERRMSFEATFTYVIQDDDFWDLAIADPTVSTTIDLTFTRAGSDTLQLTLTNAYPKFDIKKGAEGELQTEVVYKYEDIQCVVTDANASYPI